MRSTILDKCGEVILSGLSVLVRCYLGYGTTRLVQLPAGLAAGKAWRMPEKIYRVHGLVRWDPSGESSDGQRPTRGASTVVEDCVSAAAGV